MGQSQLLMIVLAVIIIGIAVAVGITQFGESALASNRDQLANDCSNIISRAQGWYRRPTSMGGGGNKFQDANNTDLTLNMLGMSDSNDNGSYVLTVGGEGAQEITCVGTGNEKTGAGLDLAVTMTYNATTDAIIYSDNMTTAAAIQ